MGRRLKAGAATAAWACLLMGAALPAEAAPREDVGRGLYVGISDLNEPPHELIEEHYLSVGESARYVQEHCDGTMQRRVNEARKMASEEFTVWNVRCQLSDGTWVWAATDPWDEFF